MLAPSHTRKKHSFPERSGKVMSKVLAASWKCFRLRQSLVLKGNLHLQRPLTVGLVRKEKQSVAGMILSAEDAWFADQG